LQAKRNKVLDSRQALCVIPFVTPKEKIAKLEAELKQARKESRCPRAPVKGIGGAIQRERQGRGMTVCALGDNSQVGKGSVSRLERTPDANPRLQTLIAIAQALGVPTTTLMQEAGIL
jgi:DNA-binding phage protein